MVVHGFSPQQQPVARKFSLSNIFSTIELDISLGHVPIFQPIAMNKGMGCPDWKSLYHMTSSEVKQVEFSALPRHQDLDFRVGAISQGN
jgi:hypothetical protein